jgi:alpha-tubulin suppressor-like RCC1 family protein
VCWGSPSTGAPFTNQTQGYVALRNAYVKSMASDADSCAPVGAACTRICVAGGYPDLYCGKWSTSAVAQLSPVAPPKNYSYISYVQVDVGPNHVCALTTHTDIYCFGLNSFGQFGTGAQSSLLTHSPETATRR